MPEVAWLDSKGDNESHRYNEATVWCVQLFRRYGSLYFVKFKK